MQYATPKCPLSPAQEHCAACQFLGTKTVLRDAPVPPSMRLQVRLAATASAARAAELGRGTLILANMRTPPRLRRWNGLARLVCAMFSTVVRLVPSTMDSVSSPTW